MKIVSLLGFGLICLALSLQSDRFRQKAAAISGNLLGSVSHDAGFSPMPKGSDKLDDCSINAIKKMD